MTVGVLSIQPKIPDISVRNQTERTISVRSDLNIWYHLWKWSTLTCPVISVGRTEMSLSIWQNCCPQYRTFVSCFNTRTITKHAVACNWVGSVKPECTFPLCTWISNISNQTFCWMEGALNSLLLIRARNNFLADRKWGTRDILFKTRLLIVSTLAGVLENFAYCSCTREYSGPSLSS